MVRVHRAFIFSTSQIVRADRPETQESVFHSAVILEATQKKEGRRSEALPRNRGQEEAERPIEATSKVSHCQTEHK